MECSDTLTGGVPASHAHHRPLPARSLQVNRPLRVNGLMLRVTTVSRWPRGPSPRMSSPRAVAPLLRVGDYPPGGRSPGYGGASRVGGRASPPCRRPGHLLLEVTLHCRSLPFLIATCELGARFQRRDPRQVPRASVVSRADVFCAAPVPQRRRIDHSAVVTICSLRRRSLRWL